MLTVLPPGMLGVERLPRGEVQKPGPPGERHGAVETGHVRRQGAPGPCRGCPRHTDAPC